MIVHRTLLFGSLVAVALAASAAAQETNLVQTPSGWFPASCVHEVVY
jgi:hypothetical protein